MVETQHHELWQTNLLDKPLEELLTAYVNSVGGETGGVPSELLQGASRIDATRASVLRSGPADCTPASEGDKTEPTDDAGEDDPGNDCAAALDGGVDDFTPLQLWDVIMKKYKVAQICEDEIARLDAEKDESKRSHLKREQALAVATAVETLAKLQHQETKKKLQAFAQEHSASEQPVVLPLKDTFISSSNPLFWFSCFVRLFPRGDCWERCCDRPTSIPSWRWAKCLLTRSDFNLWRLDVEFVQSLVLIRPIDVISSHCSTGIASTWNQ